MAVKTRYMEGLYILKDVLHVWIITSKIYTYS